MPAAEQMDTAQAIAEHFNVPVSWIYSKAESGDLPSYKIGHYRRFRRSEIQQYLEQCRQGKQ